MLVCRRRNVAEFLLIPSFPRCQRRSSPSRRVALCIGSSALKRRTMGIFGHNSAHDLRKAFERESISGAA